MADRATISLSEWQKYKDLLRKIDEKAAEEFAHAVWYSSGKFKGVGLGNIPREEIIDLAYGLVTKYGEASSAIACEMYDAIAALSGVPIPPAIPAETLSYGEVAKTINGSLNFSENEDYISSVVGRMVRQAGQDTTLQNAERDRRQGAQFAWIPSGDTCAFCLTLASRGWQYMSKRALKNGHAEHIHSNCDCAYTVRFNEKTTVEGYNPDSYLRMYQSAEGRTPKDKINSMRRGFYAEDKEKGQGTDNQGLFNVGYE